MTRHDGGYEVHLTSDASANLDVETPVSADGVDFYDSGVWVSWAEGRDFFPYERVLCVREARASRGASTSAESELEVTSGSDRADEIDAEGTASRADDVDLTIE
ncbi:MAG: hypothetical protein ABEJ82_09020 [Haloplanus sp.]